jgi:nicotinamidase-related amidase
MAMSSVVDLLEFKSQSTAPTLVLVGLHHDPDGTPRNMNDYRRALSNCRSVLERARAYNIPVAHARTLAPKAAHERLRYPPWIAGFAPARSDMVFDVLQPSCYSNTEFSRTMDYTNGNFAIAGLFGETTCLSTAIDAHHRRHNFVYLADASVCRDSGVIPTAMFHSAVSQVMSFYGRVMEGANWNVSLTASRTIR